MGKHDLWRIKKNMPQLYESLVSLLEKIRKSGTLDEAFLFLNLYYEFRNNISEFNLDSNIMKERIKRVFVEIEREIITQYKVINYGHLNLMIYEYHEILKICDDPERLNKEIKSAFRLIKGRLTSKDALGGRKPLTTKIIALLKKEFPGSKSFYETCALIEKSFTKRTVYTALGLMLK